MKNIVFFTSISLLLAGNFSLADKGEHEHPHGCEDCKIEVVSWGGAYTQSQIDAYYNPWMKMSGGSITSVDYSGGLSEIKAQVAAGNVSWGVVDVNVSDAVRGCNEGLFVPIDHSNLPDSPDKTPATKDFIEGALSECGVANMVWSTVFAYDTSKTQNVQNISDFFDVEKNPGARGIRKDPKATLEIALIADGVPVSEVYSVLSTDKGVDRAFSKLDTIKDHIVWWESGAQPQQLLDDGQVVMTTAYNNHVFNTAVSGGKPIEVNWDGQILDFTVWAIPKGTPDMEAALNFVEFATDTPRLARQASMTGYGPARKSSGVLVGMHSNGEISMEAHMPTTPENLQNSLVSNVEFWLNNKEKLDERFNEWLSN